MATVTAGFQVMPNGKDVNTDGVIPEMIKVVKNSGLEYDIGPMETVVEGDFDEVLRVIKSAQQVGINMGADEVMTTIKMHYKPDGGVSIKNKMTDV